MSLSDDIRKNELYKIFEPYITTKDMQARMKGHIELTDDAPEEAKQALSEWIALKLKSRLF